MADDGFVPAQVFSLAEYIGDEMIARGWTSADVAVRMEPKSDYVKNACMVELLLAVQDDNIVIDQPLMDELARAFDVSPQYFYNLHGVWLKHPDRRSPYAAPDCLFAGKWGGEHAPAQESER